MDFDKLTEEPAGQPSQADILAAEGAKEYSALVDRPAQTLTEKAVAGFTGLPYAELAGAMGGTSASDLARARQAESPISSILGTVLGFGAGTVTGTGGAGLLVRGAAKAASQIAGKGVLKGGLRVSTMGGIEGAGIALSDATGKAVIDRQYGPGAAAAVATSVGQGMALGASLGIGGALFAKTANTLFRGAFNKQVAQYGRAQSGRELAHQTRLAAEKEIDKLNLIGDKPFVKTAISNQQKKIAQANRDLSKYDTRINRILDGVFEESARQTRAGIGEMAADVTMMTTAGPMAAIGRRMLLPSIGKMRDAVWRGMGKLPMARAIMSSSLQRGTLTARKYAWDKAAGDIVRVPIRHDKYIDASLAAIKGSKVPPIQALTQPEFDDVADEIATADLGEFELMIRAGAQSRGIPQESVNPQIDALRRQVEYLRKTMPIRHSNNWIGDTGFRPRVPPSGRLHFSRRLRATLAPTSVLQDFMNGTLTREAAHSWWAVNPELATTYAEEIMDAVREASMHGRKFTKEEQRLIGLMTDPEGIKTGRLNSTGMVQALQKAYVSEDEQTPPPQVGGPKPKGPPKSGYESLQNVSQQLETRAMKRA